jgi:hypothetical protein
MQQCRLVVGLLSFIFTAAIINAPALAKSKEASAADAQIKALEAKIEELKPGLGEIMGVIQQHHAKLYFAANAANWDLSAYQTDEIGEGFDDVAKYYPHFKDVRSPLSDLMERFIKHPLADVAAAVKKKDKDGALKAFDTLTAGCNGCHAAANHPFIAIQPPRGDEFTNQKFTP